MKKKTYKQWCEEEMDANIKKAQIKIIHLKHNVEEARWNTALVNAQDLNELFVRIAQQQRMADVEKALAETCELCGLTHEEVPDKNMS